MTFRVWNDIASIVGESPDEAVSGQAEPIVRSLDGIFRALSNRRRRAVIVSLSEHPEGIAVTDLAVEVANRETEWSRTEIPKEAVETIQNSLYHEHLPKLEDIGAVEYDTDRNIVLPADTSDVYEHMHSIVDDYGNTYDITA